MIGQSERDNRQNRYSVQEEEEDDDEEEEHHEKEMLINAWCLLLYAQYGKLHKTQ